MQENLLFFGIPEPEQQRPNTVSNEENPIRRPEPENVEEQLRQFITSELRLEPPESVSNIKFDRVHRLGPIRTERNAKVNPRPIIAKFERFSDRELVRKAGMEINRNPASKFKIREQFPKEIEDRRKMLYPAKYRLKNNPNNRVNLVRDKLYVNGRLYVPENDPEYKLPQPKSNFRPPLRTNTPSKGQHTQLRNNIYGAIPRYTRDSRYQPPQKNHQTPIPTSNKYELLHDINDRDSSDMRMPGQKHKTISPLSDQASPKKQRDIGEFEEVISHTDSNDDLLVTPRENVLLNSVTGNSQTTKGANANSTDSCENMDLSNTQNTLSMDRETQEGITIAMLMTLYVAMIRTKNIRPTKS